MGLDLTHTLQPDVLAAAFEAQPDELFEVLSYLVTQEDPGMNRANWTLLFCAEFVPDATATKGGRQLMSDVASLLEQMSIALKAAVSQREASIRATRAHEPLRCVRFE